MRPRGGIGIRGRLRACAHPGVSVRVGAGAPSNASLERLAFFIVRAAFHARPSSRHQRRCFEQGKVWVRNTFSASLTQIEKKSQSSWPIAARRLHRRATKQRRINPASPAGALFLAGGLYPPAGVADVLQHAAPKGLVFRAQSRKMPSTRRPK